MTAKVAAIKSRIEDKIKNRKKAKKPVADSFKTTAAEFAEFCKTIAALRHPKTGCPWDLEQTHKTLRKYMLEEAYEAADAMAGNSPDDLRDELGDVLLQVVLNAQLAKDAGTFAVADVIQSINRKMLRRHPHVFGTVAEKKERKKTEIRDNWERIKGNEKAEKNPRRSGVPAYFSDHAAFPATIQALKIGKEAEKIRFDWDGPAPVMKKLLSEVQELKVEFASHRSKKPSAALLSEIGDVYFTLAQLCRHLNVDPEVMALNGNRKFLKRFKKVEQIADQRGIDILKASQKALEGLWLEAKKDKEEQAKKNKKKAP